MSQTVSDFIVQRLHQWGARHIFGYPGDGINGVLGAINRAEGKMNFVQARHEEMAAFMNNMAELITATKYWRSWRDPRFIVCVFNNEDLNQVTWEQALASDMPVVLEVKTDPEVPPLPPHITLQQAKNFSLALMKGDPNESGMIKGAARQVLESIRP
ncbi:thiamine pyrophosphate-binding protein [Bradyrhizobium sp. BR 1432]|uniref:thiamine pyrophosphate-binding protein n=1 Tax=Bradyrhizobium sp. BR 1432 TaxID=3447966 RepID=UPI003EE67A22